MRRLRLVFLFMLLVCSAWAVAADHYQLARVVLQGSKRYSQEDLLRATGLKIGSQVTAADLQHAAELLNSAGVFSTVQYLYKPAIGTINGVEADFNLTDAPHFLPAVFDNFLWFSPEELHAALHKELPLYNGELPLAQGLADQVSATLSRIMAARKLPSEVTYLLEGEQGKPPREYLFKVENSGLKVSAFRFSGVSRLEPALIEPSLAPLKGADFLHSVVDSWVTSKLLSIYRQNGFLKASAEVRPRLADGGAVVVEVTVAEGTQYRIAGYSWNGNTVIATEELSRALSLKPGDIANAMKLEGELARVRHMFGKFGREAAEVRTSTTFDGESVNYAFHVIEGEIYHMGTVEVLAPDQYKQKALGLWKMPEGAVYDNTYPAAAIVQIRKMVPPEARFEWKVREHIDRAARIVNVQLEITSK